MLAQRYGCRPSDLLAVDDAYTRYCIDEAAALAGLLHEPDDQAPHPAEPRGAALDLDHMTISGKVPIIRKPKPKAD